MNPRRLSVATRDFRRTERTTEHGRPHSMTQRNAGYPFSMGRAGWNRNRVMSVGKTDQANALTGRSSHSPPPAQFAASATYPGWYFAYPARIASASGGPGATSSTRGPLDDHDLVTDLDVDRQPAGSGAGCAASASGRLRRTTDRRPRRPRSGSRAARHPHRPSPASRSARARGARPPTTTAARRRASRDPVAGDVRAVGARFGHPPMLAGDRPDDPRHELRGTPGRRRATAATAPRRGR